MASQEDIKNRQFLSVIGDRDSVHGLLLAGIGHVTDNGTEKEYNFLIVDDKITTLDIEKKFVRLTVERKDIAVVLVTQPIADRIRHLVAPYNKGVPTVLEIPSKDHPYDPEKDSVLNRVHQVSGK